MLSSQTAINPSSQPIRTSISPCQSQKPLKNRNPHQHQYSLPSLPTTPPLFLPRIRVPSRGSINRLPSTIVMVSRPYFPPSAHNLVTSIQGNFTVRVGVVVAPFLVAVMVRVQVTRRGAVIAGAPMVSFSPIVSFLGLLEQREAGERVQTLAVGAGAGVSVFLRHYERVLLLRGFEMKRR